MSAGEVVIQGANVMRGYLNRPEATAETVVDGWLHTGDVGILDEDGYLRIVDRIKDMIIRGGENIYPKEIESVLRGHHAVLEAAVVGAPHAVYGEVPVAYVAPYPGADRHRRRAARACASSTSPRSRFRSRSTSSTHLPKNPVGKIDKPALRASLTAAPASHPIPGPYPAYPREGVTMGFTKPNLPPVEPEEFLRRPFMERMKVLALHWVENGFGSPRMVHMIYIVKLLLFYILGGVAGGDRDLGPRPFWHVADWWNEPIVYQKAGPVDRAAGGASAWPARGARSPASSSR